MFQDLYAFTKKYAIPEDREDFWEGVKEDAQSFADKYETFDGKLARDFIIAWMNHLERVSGIGEKR